MSTHRIRHRQSKQAEPAEVDRDQEAVDDLADELLVLWRAVPSALARDSAGLLNDDRHAKGGAKGSPSTINVNVIDAAARIEVGLYDVEAQAVRLLNEDRAKRRSVPAIIAGLSDWHRALKAKRAPLAKHLKKDLESWVFDARGALGLRKYDRRLGPLCPDHRDTHPAPLLEVGAVARLSTSLLAGPPPVRLLIGPCCPRGLHVSCRHRSCEWIRSGRVVDAVGQPTDWVYSRTDGELVWRSHDGSPAWDWETSASVRCPHCKTKWTTTTERRVLARRLADLGDARPDAAALLS